MSPDDSERHPSVAAACTTLDPCETCRACRIRRTLTLAQTFSRAQVADLIHMALKVGTDLGSAASWDAGEQAGWDAAGAALAAAVVAAGPVPVFTERWHRMEGYRQRARHEHDIAAVWPWRGDHLKGPVPDWDYPAEAVNAAVTYAAQLRTMPPVSA